MKALKLLSDKTISLVEIDEPVINDKEILINLGSCGICGSDIQNVFADSCKPTSKLGHEITGTIVKVGKSFNGKNYEGKRVFVNHHAPCNSCHYCIHGNETMCDKFTDNIFPCGISEKIILSEWIVNNQSIFELPDSMTFEKGSMIEPLACCIRGWKKISFIKGDSVLIFGIGPIGILHAMLAKIYGASTIYCVDINENKVNVDINKIYSKEVRLLTTYAASNEEIHEALHMITKKEIDVNKIITHRYTILESKDAFKKLYDRNDVIKAIIINK